MSEIDPIIFTVDDRPVQDAVKRMNASIDKLRDNTVRSNMGSAWEKMARDLERVSRPIESFGGSMERVLKGLASGVRGATEFGLAIALSTKAIGAEIAAHSALEASLNRVRAARIAAAGWAEGLGGALTTATEVGTIVALERVAENTYARAKQIQ